MGAEQKAGRVPRNSGRGSSATSTGRKAARASERRDSSIDELSPMPTKDENYNLISVLYHALQGAETYATYISDAERAGDDELSEFFTECREEEMERAARAKELLADRLMLEEEEYEEDELDDDRT